MDYENIEKILNYIGFNKEGNVFYVSFTLDHYIIEINFLEIYPYSFILYYKDKPSVLVYQSYKELDFTIFLYDYFKSIIRKIKIRNLLKIE